MPLLPSQSQNIRHLKRKSRYVVLLATQADKDCRENDSVVFDYGDHKITAIVQSSTQPVVVKGTWLMVYYGGTHIWCRPVSEMNDGRFESLDDE